MKTKLLVIICFFTFILSSNAQVEITSGGTAMAYTLTVPGVFTLKTGIQVTFKANVVCGTPVTINVNSTGAIFIKKEGASLDLAANDIRAGQIVNLVYDGNFWQMLSASGNATSSGANLFLSNLSSPTAINQSLVTGTDNTYDLGTNTTQWRDNYLSGMLYIDGAPWLNNPNTSNTMLGTRSANSGLSTALYNTGVGANAGGVITTGTHNTLVGQNAGQNITTQTDNTLIGSWSAGLASSLGSGNTYLGSYTGYQGVNAASNNTFIGHMAGQSTSTGGSNTFVGYQTGYNSTTASTTTAIGYAAGVGANPFFSGADNTFIGANSGLGSATQRTNATAIGANAKVNADNALVLGDNVNVGIGTSSPGALLDIGPATNASLRITNTNSTSGYAAYFNNTSATNTNAALVVQVANPAAPSATIMGGNVGVGTTAPTSLFSVGTGAASPFQVNSSGNIIKLNGATTSFPSTNAVGVLTNDGTGTLTWGAAASAITASNGLTKTINDIQLGGTLTANTTITNGNFNMIHNLSGTGNFDIQDAGVSKFYVKNTGFVGVNNNAPAFPLDVAGQTVIQDNTISNSQVLYVGTTSVAGTASSRSDGIFIQRSGANANATHQANGLEVSVTNSGTTSTNVAAYLSASGATNNYAIIVPATGGNVGIGTTTPAYKLHSLASTALASGNDVVGTLAEISGTSGARVVGLYGWAKGSGASGKSIGVAGIADYVNTPTDAIGVYAGFGSLGALPVTPGVSTALYAYGNGVSALSGLFMNGAVGIGTTSPSANARLAIKDGHIQVQQTIAPTIVVNSGAGTACGTAPSASVTGNDVAGQITLTIGTVCTYAPGAQCTLMFNKNYAGIPIVIITPANQTAASGMNSRQTYITATSGAGSSMTINFGIQAGGAGTYIYNYMVIEQ